MYITRKQILIRYIFFAGISTIANIGMQFVVNSFAEYFYFLFSWLFTTYILKELTIYAAIGSGTIIGLLVKYILDKKYIFYCNVKNKKDDVKKFGLYTLMGVITTIIFWSSELLFHYYVNISYSKYIGAIIGLTIGYVVKYYLDKNLVFNKK